MRRSLRLGGRAGEAEGVASGGGGQTEAAHRLQALPQGRVFGGSPGGVNEGGGSVTCPAGVTTTDFRMARDGWYRPVKLFRFPREACDGCDLKRSVPVGPQWQGRCPGCASLPAGRQQSEPPRGSAAKSALRTNETSEQKKALRDKCASPGHRVERKISEVLRLHGLRRGRYFGEHKTTCRPSSRPADRSSALRSSAPV